MINVWHVKKTGKLALLRNGCVFLSAYELLKQIKNDTTFIERKSANTGFTLSELLAEEEAEKETISLNSSELIDRNEAIELPLILERR